MSLLRVIAVVALVAVPAAAQEARQGPIRGLSEGPALASAYDAVLNASFDEVSPRLAGACVETPTWCVVMHSVSLWWQIALDPESRRLDARFKRTVDGAIASAERWTEREPHRAEAWFAVGAAYGARAQFRVQRRERLAAARDGKRIKNALEQALALDPLLHDAKFGIGLYRYYADVAPVALRMLRWLLLLPGGDREEGLQLMEDAREHGVVIRGEADYQLHLIYLWYEDRASDALALIENLQERYPRNPLFPLHEAHIHDVYFHDAEAGERVLNDLIARAEAAEVNAPDIALRRARAALAALRARGAR